MTKELKAEIVGELIAGAVLGIVAIILLGTMKGVVRAKNKLVNFNSGSKRTT